MAHVVVTPVVVTGARRDMRELVLHAVGGGAARDRQRVRVVRHLRPGRIPVAGAVQADVRYRGAYGVLVEAGSLDEDAVVLELHAGDPFAAQELTLEPVAAGDAVQSLDADLDPCAG
ncbi:MAG: hypothetical protein JHC84_19865 [Solirubrobacteraceae bacterium]|nr:hypothetical protein [Solirubrobacteraceae bacterium]